MWTSARSSSHIPSLAIITPTSGEVLSNLNYTATGTASGLDGVDGVFVADAGGAWVPAATSDNWNHWNANILLTPEASAVSAYAVNSFGVPSSTNMVNVTFSLTNFVQLVKNNKTQGRLSIFINSVGPASSPNRVTPLKSGAEVQVGSHVTLTATPGRNQIFSNWVFGASAPYSITNTPTLRFLMQTNFIAEANFVTNVFLPVKGTYYGLFAPTNAPREQTNSGAVTLSVASSGAFSGRFTIGSRRGPR